MNNEKSVLKPKRKEGRTFKTTRNLIVSLALQILVFILNYISRIIFVQYLDSSYLGINSLFTNVISVFTLAELGISTALTYSFYKPLKENDEERICQLVHYFSRIYLIISGVVLVIGLAFIPLLPYVVNLPNNIDNLYWYYVMFVVETACSYLFVHKTTLLVADQQNYLINIVIAIFEIIKFALRILFLILFRNYFIYLGVGIGTYIVSNFIKSYIADRCYPFLKKKSITKLPKEEKDKIFKNVRSTFLYRLCGVLESNTDSILISIMIGTIVVGYYSNYIVVVSSIVSIINMIFASVKSSVGNYLLEVSDVSKRLSLYLTLEKLNQIIIGICVCCFFGVFDDFILFSYGEKYLLTFSVLFAIVLNFYTSNIKQNTWVFRETAGIFDQVKYLPLVSMILNIGLSVLLGYFFGVFGILIATTISRLAYPFWREPMILYREVFKTSSVSYLINMFVYMIFAMGVGVGTYYLCDLVQLNSLIINIIVKLLIALGVSIPLFCLINLRGTKYIIERIKTLTKKKNSAKN